MLIDFLLANMSIAIHSSTQHKMSMLFIFAFSAFFCGYSSSCEPVSAGVESIQKSFSLLPFCVFCGDFLRSIKELIDESIVRANLPTNSLIDMARKPSPTLTDAELRPMEVLWERGPSTVAEVVHALPQKLGLSYSTVLTTLRILEQKGYVEHTKEGQAFVYHPIIDRNQARKKVLKHVLNRFFNDSPELLVMKLLESEQIDAEDLQRIQRLINQGEKE
jgi:predicted transcriptional regulator